MQGGELELFSVLTLRLFLKHLTMSPTRETDPRRTCGGLYCISIKHIARDESVTTAHITI